MNFKYKKIKHCKATLMKSPNDKSLQMASITCSSLFCTKHNPSAAEYNDLQPQKYNLLSLYIYGDTTQMQDLKI
jgi:hypothetical protein